MKRNKFVIIAVLTVLFSGLCFAQSLKDGTYKGESQASYTQEPYWGECKLTVKNDKIISFDFYIIDKDKNQIFDKDYEKVFAGNDEYILQCRNDLKGIEQYVKAYKKNMNMNDVDAVSGATWSYNIFKATVEQALKKAEK
ncbi:MAG: FMN-binding protein [Treponema sp.]|nr:FMN-binding protein [Treponema sp.]